MLYKYETHCHCNRCSRCAHSTPEELVRAYSEKGFSGMVLTDHFIHGNHCVDPKLPWAQQMQQYYNAYLEAVEAAKGLDFDVIFGIEHAYGGGLEVLCYGIDLDFLVSNPDIPQLSIQEFSDRVHQVGGLMIHAHPYRWAGPELELPLDVLDGIEVYNAGNAPDKNVLALELAQKHRMIQTAGSDLHHIDEPKLGTTGIALPYRIRNGQEFVNALKKNAHQLIIPR